MDIFTQLLRANELRGADSTGVIYVENDKSFSILKEATPAAWAHMSITGHDLMKTLIRKGKVLIGHNRAATVGKVSDETAHPFVVDKTFAMVHNGTLYGHRALKDTAVDSEALAHHLQPFLEADGINDKDFEEELGKVSGAYAIAAYSQKQDKVFLMRNSQRPLTLIETSDAFYWASEGMMLLWILSRNQVGHSDIKRQIILKEDNLYTIDLAKSTLTEEEYVPKKAMAVIKATPVVIGTPPTKIGSNKQEGISKAEVKRLRRRFLGSRHTFYADDYIETNFPKTIADGESLLTIMGRLDGTCFPVDMDQCLATLDAEELFGKDWKVGQVLEQYYHGLITEVRFDKDSRTAHFVLSEVKPIRKSTVVDDVAAKANNVIQLTQGKWNAQTPPTVH